eukprot:2380826-Pyramimonas_sp.AAC.1
MQPAARPLRRPPLRFQPPPPCEVDPGDAASTRPPRPLSRAISTSGSTATPLSSPGRSARSSPNRKRPNRRGPPMGQSARIKPARDLIRLELLPPDSSSGIR